MNQTLASIESVVMTSAFACGTEDELQSALASVLAPLGAVREVQLDHADRIDFMVGTVGIEVKMKGDISALTRQLLRYAQHSQISALVLVTTREQYRLQLPQRLNDKPLRVLSLMGAFA